MNVLEVFKLALSSLAANKLRAILTILGIVIGIFSIIVITTITSMLDKSIEDGFSQLNQNTFQLQKWPAVHVDSPEERAKIRNRRNLTLEEYEELKDALRNAEAVGAELWQWGKRVKFENEKTNPNVSVAGCTPEAQTNNDWYVENGRGLNSSDVLSARNVVVLGSDIAKTLFKYVDPIGNKVSIDGEKFKVIGVLEEKGASFGRSQDTYVVIPITKFTSMYGKRRSVNITIRAAKMEDVDNLIDESISKFRVIRGLTSFEENDFDVRSNEGSINALNETLGPIKLVIFLISSVALIAAGIGIMNIMLVTVTERTREIGIRKAIGAKKGNILFQFLAEAIVLCLIGGGVGIVLGWGVGLLIGVQMNAAVVVPYQWITFGVSVCVAIGVIFGVYPAYKASSLDPIEALRHE